MRTKKSCADILAAQNFPNRRLAPHPIFFSHTRKRETHGGFRIWIFSLRAIGDRLAAVAVGASDYCGATAACIAERVRGVAALRGAAAGCFYFHDAVGIVALGFGSCGGGRGCFGGARAV